MAAETDFTTVMAEKGIKVVLTIRALLYATDPLFSRLNHKLVLEELMEFPCARLEVGAT